MAGIGDGEIDYSGNHQVPLCASHANAVRLLEAEQRVDSIHLVKSNFEIQADKVLFELNLYIFFMSLFLYMSWGVGTFTHLATESPLAAAFVSILLMSLFLAGMYSYFCAEKLITEMFRDIKFLAELQRNVRVDARILMELEKNRKKRLTANIVNNNEGPVIDMKSFITRTKRIYDATELFDLEKVYHKRICLFGCSEVFTLACWSSHTSFIGTVNMNRANTYSCVYEGLDLLKGM